MSSHTQLNFRCPRCHLQGLTPEVSSAEGLALSQGELEMRCPKCGAILDIDGSSPDRILSLVSEPASLVKEALQQLKNRAR